MAVPTEPHEDFKDARLVSRVPEEAAEDVGDGFGETAADGAGVGFEIAFGETASGADVEAFDLVDDDARGGRN